MESGTTLTMFWQPGGLQILSSGYANRFPYNSGIVSYAAWSII